MNLAFGNPSGVAFLGAAAIFSLISLALVRKRVGERSAAGNGSAKVEKKLSQCSIKECAALFGRVIEDCRAMSMSLCDKVESEKGEIHKLLAQIENERASTIDLIERAKQAEEALNSALKAAAAAISAADGTDRYAEARRLIETGVDPGEVSRQLAIPECEVALLLEMKAS